jgi:anti-anti-sigma factor
MAKLKSKVRTVNTARRKQVCHVALEGIISAPTLKAFRQLMRKPLESTRDLLLDLGGISYINSSGLGELVRVRDALQKNSLSLVVIRLDPEVDNLMRMLGLTEFFHIMPNSRAALAALDEGLRAPLAAGERPAQMRKTGVFVPIGSVPKPRLPEARVLLGTNGDQFFNRFLVAALTGKSGGTVVVNSQEETKAALRSGRIDIAIIESHLPDARSICAELKTNVDNGTLPVIFIYPNIEETKSLSPVLRICEDEYVIEPFEVRELLALAQSEYHRCRAEAILFSQEFNLDIPTVDSEIERGLKLMEDMLLASGLPKDGADSFFYALREAVDNARRHGNNSDQARNIELLYVLDKEKVTITIADEGQGFDYAEVLQRARQISPVEQARLRQEKGGFGGLGIGLMLRCCDKVEYFAPGNVVKLTKFL